jgi:hypothetical protein
MHGVGDCKKSSRDGVRRGTVWMRELMLARPSKSLFVKIWFASTAGDETSNVGTVDAFIHDLEHCDNRHSSVAQHAHLHHLSTALQPAVGITLITAFEATDAMQAHGPDMHTAHTMRMLCDHWGKRGKA